MADRSVSTLKALLLFCWGADDGKRFLAPTAAGQDGEVGDLADNRVSGSSYGGAGL